MTRPLPIRRIFSQQLGEIVEGEWPTTLAPVAQLLRDGLEPAKVTILVGENGTGKSTIVEAIATAFGMAPEGGSTGARHSTSATESALWTALTLHRGAGASRWGYFLRAETTHGLFTYLEQNPGSPRSVEPHFHTLSHGESFVAMLQTGRFNGEGLFVLDEPEAGLSFAAQLHLLAQLDEMRARPGVQVVLATHSPVLTALPGATILELDGDGFHESSWADLDVVDHYRRFLAAPQRYLRHLLT